MGRYPLRSFSFSAIKENYASLGFGWVIVHVSFDDKGTTAHPGIEIEVPIKYETDWTIERVHSEAFAKARTILEVAAKLFAENSAPSLQAVSDKLEMEGRSDLREAMGGEPDDKSV